jgi:hypothetical protein
VNTLHKDDDDDDDDDDNNNKVESLLDKTHSGLNKCKPQMLCMEVGCWQLLQLTNRK